MQTTKLRQIEYHTLVKKMWRMEDNAIQPLMEVVDLLKFIKRQARAKRFYELKNSKCCLLDDFVVESNEGCLLICGLFKSAIKDFRPKLINTSTAVERDNPKEKKEGEIEKTHFCIKVVNEAEYQEVFIVLEKNGYGISINQIIEYLNEFNKKLIKSKNLKRSYTIKHMSILRSDFRDVLGSMNRVRIAEIHMNKQLLGSDALNYSNRQIAIKEDVVLMVKAKKGFSLQEFSFDCLQKVGGGPAGISRMRVWGNTDDGQHILIDTELFGKKTEISCDINPDTGEVITFSIYRQLKEMIIPM